MGSEKIQQQEWKESNEGTNDCLGMHLPKMMWDEKREERRGSGTQKERLASLIIFTVSFRVCSLLSS